MTWADFLPTPPDLEDAPELGVLVVLKLALRVADLALVTAYPHLVGDDPPTDPAERAAAVVLARTHGLQQALDRYCDLVTDRLENPDRR